MLGFVLVLPIGSRDGRAATTTLSFVVLLMSLPIALASIMGGAFGKDGTGHGVQLSPFQGAKPVSTLFLTRSRLNSSALSLLIGWVIALMLLPIGIYLSGHVPTLRGLWDGWVGRYGPARTLWTSLLLVPALFVISWKGTVGGMLSMLTGGTGLWA